VDIDFFLGRVLPHTSPVFESLNIDCKDGAIWAHLFRLALTIDSKLDFPVVWGFEIVGANRLFSIYRTGDRLKIEL